VQDAGEQVGVGARRHLLEEVARDQLDAAGPVGFAKADLRAGEHRLPIHQGAAQSRGGLQDLGQQHSVASADVDQ
jgi:hypothetical protein